MIKAKYWSDSLFLEKTNIGVILNMAKLILITSITLKHAQNSKCKISNRQTNNLQRSI